MSKPDHQTIILSKLRVWFFPSKCYPELLTLSEVEITRKNVCFDIPFRTLTFQRFWIVLVISNQHIIRNEVFFTTLLICSIKVPTANSVFVELWLLEDYSLRWLSRSNGSLRITGFFFQFSDYLDVWYRSSLKSRTGGVKSKIQAAILWC